MNLVNDIPPDEIVVLTAELRRAFLVVDCDPECHCCEKTISVGQKFKLAFIERPNQDKLPFAEKSTDEMLCYHCTPAKLLVVERQRRAVVEAARRKGGFTRPHHVTSEFYGGVRF